MEKVNLYELLKDAPKGCMLYTSCFGGVTYKGTDGCGHLVLMSNSGERYFKVDEYGKLFAIRSQFSEDSYTLMPQKGECILFPSSSNKDWNSLWQSVVMSQCLGCVIIDKNGFSYLVGNECLYPTDPNVGDEVIRMHKFDFEGSRFATEKETENFHRELSRSGWFWDKEKNEMSQQQESRGKWVVSNINIHCTTRDNKPSLIEKGEVLYAKPTSGMFFGKNFFQKYNLVDIHGDEYCLDSNKFHDWSIDDARDGDVLCNSQFIVILKSWDAKNNEAECHAVLLRKNDNRVIDCEYEKSYKVRHQKLTFADHNTCRFLFDTMEKNGLQWDSENKIIYRSYIGLPKFKSGDRIRYNGSTYIITELTKSGYSVYSTDGGDCSEIGYCNDQDRITLCQYTADVLNPFDKIIVRDSENDVWRAELYSHTVYITPQNQKEVGERLDCAWCYNIKQTNNSSQNPLVVGLGGKVWRICVPYNEQTKHLIGTTGNCAEQYKIK